MNPQFESPQGKGSKAGSSDDSRKNEEEQSKIYDLEKELKKMKTELAEANAKIVKLQEDHANKVIELSKTFISALGTHITANPADSSDSDSEESQPSLGVGDLVKVDVKSGLKDKTGHHRLQYGEEVYVKYITDKLKLVNVSREEGGDSLLKRAQDPSLFELCKKAVAQDPECWLDLKQPFPMASDCVYKFLAKECTFTADSLREVPVRSDRGSLTWNGTFYTAQQFEKLLNEWRKKFQEGSPFESSSYKAKTLEKLTEWAFQNCAKIEVR